MKNAFRQIKRLINNERIYFALKREWKRARRLSVRAEGARALIVPCDPWGVVGSRGDQAMITATLQHLRDIVPRIEVDVLADSQVTDEAIRAMGMNPVAEWNEPFAAWMEKSAAKYGYVFIVGADVTDGVYGISAAMKMLMFYDVFTRFGAKTRYLGFSWSKTPHYMIGRVIRQLTPGLPLPVRDPISYKRLERFTTHRPLIQVADSAFMMKPNLTPRAAKVAEYCAAERANGRKVIALNVHSMFNDVDAKSADWNAAFIKALARMMNAHEEVTLLFLPHDNRPNVSDRKLLRSLFETMPSELLPRCHLVDEVMNADEIKAVLGSVDGLVAGRMHISIAALGQGVPVFALVYQGKFEGLWQFFSLPNSTMIEPKMFFEREGDAGRQLNDYVVQLGELKDRVSERLPNVLSLASGNFLSTSSSPSPNLFA